MPGAMTGREAVHPLTIFLQDSTWINFDVGAFKTEFWQLTFDGLAYGAIYALVAMGYTLVYGVLKLINFAHSEVFISGAYAVWFTLSRLGFGPSAPTMSTIALIGDILLSALAAMAASAAVAVL